MRFVVIIFLSAYLEEVLIQGLNLIIPNTIESISWIKACPSFFSALVSAHAAHDCIRTCVQTRRGPLARISTVSTHR